MKDIAEANSNSSVLEEETSDELSFEELESVAGGNGGCSDKDGDGFWENVGEGIGKVFDSWFGGFHK